MLKLGDRPLFVPHFFYADLYRAAEPSNDHKKEHHVSDMVLKELESMSKSEDQWGAKMYVFTELVEHHIKDEEKKVFKSAEKALGHDEIQNIMKQFELEKQKIKKSLK
jgi:hemerythrin-like domain-containing protein